MLTGDPGTGRFVPAAGVCPGSGKGVAVLAERALVIGRGTDRPGPDREGVAVQFIHVVERLARATVVARPNLSAGSLSKGLQVPYYFYACILPLLMLKIDVLDEEEAAFHPLVGNRPLRFSRYLPGAHQPVQAP